MITLGQRILAFLWTGSLRPLFEPVARRWIGGSDRIRTGLLAGSVFPGAGLAQLLGIYELEVQSFLASRLRPGDVFFDVGANRGFLSLLAAVRVGTEGKVVAFEPFADSAEKIHEIVSLNGLDGQIVVRQLALSKSAGRAHLFVPESSPEGVVASLRRSPGAGSPGRLIEVETAALDDLVLRAAESTPRVIKIDVEGAEVDVLRGARELVERGEIHWIVETHGEAEEREARRCFANLGYRLESIANRRSDRVFPRHLTAEPVG